MKIRLLVPVITLAFAAAASAQDHQHRHAAPGGSHESHHPKANPALMAFHDLMEPLWHSPAGKETNARACKSADEVIGRAKAAAARPSPDHAALVRAAETLKRNCGEAKDAEITATLDQLHGAFHRLAGMK